MSDEPENGGTFELEPEEDRPPPAPSVPARSTPMPAVPLDTPAGEPEGPDERTLAERKGTAVPTTTDALPAPPGWPGELVSFPLRPPGPTFLCAMGGSFVIVDLMACFTFLVFPAFVLLILMWVFCLRAQQGVIGKSAAGKDSPIGWLNALELDYGALRQMWVFGLVFIVLFLSPLALAMKWLPGTTIALVLSPYLAVAMLGWSLGDHTLVRPWKALPWLARRPLEFVVGTLGWWALWYGGALIGPAYEHGPPAVLMASAAVRAATIYLLLVSARAIGVAGRSWTPWGFQEPEQHPDR